MRVRMMNSHLDSVDRSRRDKPDLRISNMVWVEVETMRALSFVAQIRFFVLTRNFDGN